MFLKSGMAWFLCGLLVWPVAAQNPAVSPPSQAPVAPPVSAPPVERTLKIFVLEGQHAVNSLPDRVIVQPVVEVRDSNDQPVEGADVTFELPAAGPGGLFVNQQKVFKTKTNFRGQAGARLQPDTQTGKYEIRVTATAGNQTASAFISQTNSTQPVEIIEARKHRSVWAKWKWYIIAGAAAGVAAGVVLGTRNGESIAPPPISVGTGPITIGAPR